MVIRSLLPLLFCVAILSAQNQPAPGHRPISSAQIYGFTGPIHTSKGITTELHKDPRSQPKLPIRLSERGWMLFDQSGQLREEGNVGPSGDLQQLVRRSYDANGEQISSEITVGQKVTRYRQWTSATPQGTETINLVDDKVLSTVVSRSEQERQTGETTVKDEEGKTISFTRSQTDGSIQTMQSWGKDGRLVIDMRRTLDDDGNVTETSRFDESGRLVSTMSFNQGQLTSFWQDPDCKCTNVAAFRDDGGSTVFYSTDEAGKLYKEIQHHPGRLTNMEIDDDELYSQDGSLLERIAYAYVRDAHGNWIRRTVSVMDPNTNAMIAVREDVRELSYF